nr:hypothetical protein [uncultured Flavobacterium sp.]
MVNSRFGFWKIVPILFGIGLPIFLHNVGRSIRPIPSYENENPYISIGLLAFSILLWLYLFIRFFQKEIIVLFSVKNNVERVKDSRLLSRAATINTEKTSNISVNSQALLFRIFFLLLYIASVTFYYYYSYQTESYGSGWNFISFFHPLVICPIVLLFYALVNKLNASVIQPVIRNMNLKNSEDELLKSHGIKTMAKILKVSETGARYDFDPILLYDLEFTDEKNQVHQCTAKKIVNSIDIGNIHNVKEAEIFYLPENPKKVAFAYELLNDKLKKVY